MTSADHPRRIPQNPRSVSPVARTISRLAVLSGALLMLSGAAAASASADQVAVAVQSAVPEQGVPLTLAFTGSATSIDQYGDGPYLYAVIRPTGGIGCQSSYGADQAAAGGASSNLFDSHEVSPGGFTVQTTYDPPNVGSYLVCAWLENDEWDDSGDPSPPSHVRAGPAQTTLATRGPQVGELAVSVPSPARPDVAFQINYTTQTDQQLTLDSVVKRAGGLPCASSYELEQQQNQSENDMFGYGGGGIFGGPTTTTATDTESAAGPYVICSWIEGPSTGEVDAAAATPIYVGTPPPPPPPAIPPACVVPRSAGLGLSTVERRLIGHHCTIGHIRYVRAHAKRGTVLGLSAVAGHRLANNASIGIIVSAGRHGRGRHA